VLRHHSLLAVMVVAVSAAGGLRRWVSLERRHLMAGLATLALIVDVLAALGAAAILHRFGTAGADAKSHGESWRMRTNEIPK
jgi:hypothetical protein